MHALSNSSNTLHVAITYVYGIVYNEPSGGCASMFGEAASEILIDRGMAEMVLRKLHLTCRNGSVQINTISIIDSDYIVYMDVYFSRTYRISMTLEIPHYCVQAFFSKFNPVSFYDQ